MNGHNPDASLLPSVGGAIAPMSGGGQEGGLVDANGQSQVLQVGLVGYENNPEMVQALQTLAPTEVGSRTIRDYFEKKGSPSDDEALKREILGTIIRPQYLKDMQFVIESKKDNGITEANIQAVITHLSNQSFDISKIVFSLDSTGLHIEMEVPAATATASAVATATATDTPAKAVTFAI